MLQDLENNDATKITGYAGVQIIMMRVFFVRERLTRMKIAASIWRRVLTLIGNRPWISS
jgi:hypothetical protein